jgi:hypothetical protein
MLLISTREKLFVGTSTMQNAQVRKMTCKHANYENKAIKENVKTSVSQFKIALRSLRENNFSIVIPYSSMK